jgi:hypothetical protein
MSSDYTYVSITNTGTNTFTATVASTGGSTGAAGAYIPAIKASGVSESTCTISSPSNGNIQIHDITLTNGGQRVGTDILLQMPNTITNGAGGNTTAVNILPPVLTGFLLNNGTSITPGVEAFGGTSSPGSYNQFKLTSVNNFTGGDVMVILKF